MKIAADFLDIPNLKASLLIAAEFREQSILDVLQVETQLWHAWNSLHSLIGESQNAKKRRVRPADPDNDENKREHARRRKAGHELPASLAAHHAFVCPYENCLRHLDGTLYSFAGVISHV